MLMRASCYKLVRSVSDVRVPMNHSVGLHKLSQIILFEFVVVLLLLNRSDEAAGLVSREAASSEPLFRNVSAQSVLDEYLLLYLL